MSSLPRALLLDLDDTLLQSYDGHEQCWADLCERFASRLGQVGSTELFQGIRHTARWYWSVPERSRLGRLDLRGARRTIVRRALERLGIDAVEVGEELADTYTAIREERVRPHSGALEVLRAVRAKGVRTGLLTNGSSEFQRRKIERFSLEPLLDVIVIEGEFGVGKPDDRVFLHALESLAVEPPDAWMVGDNLHADIEPAQRLGIFAIWVDQAGAGPPSEAGVYPDRTIRSLSELL
jgi:putative hydrolase of the HAD superfamily